MSWRFLAGLVLAGICLIYTAQAMLAEAAPLAEQRTAAQKLFKEGNFKEALAKFRELLADPKNDSPALSEDYRMTAQAMQRLAMEKDLDELREKVLTDHPLHWRVMQTIAHDYAHGNHYGFIIAGKFERGNHRGGGEWANVAARDYVRALQIYETALPLMLKDDDGAAKSEFCFDLAGTLQHHPHLRNRLAFSVAHRSQETARCRKELTTGRSGQFRRAGRCRGESALLHGAEILGSGQERRRAPALGGEHGGRIARGEI